MIKLETYIALLRGVNVSGQKKVPMSKLKALLTDLGLMNVQTYIQSGNVIFRSEESNCLLLKKLIEEKIKNEFGFAVDVIIRTWDELLKTVLSIPFKDEEVFLDTAIYVTFVDRFGNDEMIGLVDDKRNMPDLFEVIGNEIYIYCPGGYGNTKLSNTFFERKLKKVTTTRNLNTVRQLLEMGRY